MKMFKIMCSSFFWVKRRFAWMLYTFHLLGCFTFQGGGGGGGGGGEGGRLNFTVKTKIIVFIIIIILLDNITTYILVIK